MKRIGLVLLLVACLGLTVLAGCSKGTKVHYEEETTTETTSPVITGD